MLCYHYGVDRLRHGGYVISRAQFDPFYTSRLHPYLAYLRHLPDPSSTASNLVS
jgi:hypothetical protein